MWAGRVNLTVASTLVAVEYDAEETARLVRARCSRWRTDDERDVPAAFGVRTARVGLRRRRVGFVHHGSPVRHRTADLAGAVEALVAILTDMERPRARDGIAVAARLFAAGDRAALVDAAPASGIDDRALRDRGVEEVVCWRVDVDPASGRLTVGDRSFDAAAFVVAGHGRLRLDDARRRLWGIGEGDRSAWADLLDRHGDLVAVAADAVTVVASAVR